MQSRGILIKEQADHREKRNNDGHRKWRQTPYRAKEPERWRGMVVSQFRHVMCRHCIKFQQVRYAPVRVTEDNKQIFK